MTNQTKQHNKHSELYQDGNMLGNGVQDVKFISAPPSKDFVNKNQRVLAKYEKGDWKVESQVQIDSEWYIASRTFLHNVPDDKPEFSGHPKRPVKYNMGMFSNLSKFKRLLLVPIYTLMIAYYCVKGVDVNLQILEKDTDN